MPTWLPEAGIAASAAVGVGAVAWGLWRLGWLQKWLLPLAGLFVRVDPGDAAHHITRAVLLDELGKQRVSSTDELRERLSINQGTLLWHLRVLERLEVVRSRRVGRARVWYRKDAGAPTAEEFLVESTPDRRAVLDAITSTPGLSLSDLARTTGLAKSSVHRHVAALASGGIVETRKEAFRTLLNRTPT